MAKFYLEEPSLKRKEEAIKYIENGQLYIRRCDAVYTIQGTRVR